MIVFCDVDGTLLDSHYRLLPGTVASIRQLKEQNIPFVIVSARNPPGIFPILEEYGFECAIVSFSGALILDENRNVLFSKSIPYDEAREVLDFIINEKLDCTWSIYSNNRWIVPDKKDKMVLFEESCVPAVSEEGSISSLAEGEEIHKLLCMCESDEVVSVQKALKARFPNLSIVQSTMHLIEIMQKGVSKGEAVLMISERLGESLGDSVAFGDNYNDVEMLDLVGHPFLMGNAPKALKDSKENYVITDDLNSEGIYNALRSLGAVL